MDIRIRTSTQPRPQKLLRRFKNEDGEKTDVNFNMAIGI